MYQEKGLYMPYSKQVKDALPDVPIILAAAWTTATAPSTPSTMASPT